MDKREIAIIIPAYNEEKSIEEVILDFHNEVNEGKIYVINNNSNDNTASIAEKTYLVNSIKGRIINVKERGKANAIKTAFRKIEADIYIMVDGDNTYSAKDYKSLVNPIIEEDCDMVVGDRISSAKYDKENKRLFHSFGNKLVRFMINILFKSRLKDIMSGYRVFNRRFVKNYPILCEGFELETEMTLHALNTGFRIKEIPINYKDRIGSSHSKLSTLSDGMKVLKTIFLIFKDYNPFSFFSLVSLLFLLSGVIIGISPVIEYFKFNYVYKVPSAILASGLIVISFLSFSIGIILDTINRYQRFNYELKLNEEKNKNNN